MKQSTSARVDVHLLERRPRACSFAYCSLSCVANSHWWSDRRRIFLTHLLTVPFSVLQTAIDEAAGAGRASRRDGGSAPRERQVRKKLYKYVSIYLNGYKHISIYLYLFLYIYMYIYIYIYVYIYMPSQPSLWRERATWATGAQEAVYIYIYI